MKEKTVFENGMFHIIPTSILRKTPNVLFTKLPVFEGLGGVDHVIHQPFAQSPTIKDRQDEKFWYMHTDQEDNLVVFSGKRTVELYTKSHNKIETFEVTCDEIKRNGKTLYKGEAILGWSKNVFHRVTSGEKGSNSINFAVRSKDFDMKTNFNIYKLDTDTGEYKIERYGHKDQ